MITHEELIKELESIDPNDSNYEILVTRFMVKLENFMLTDDHNKELEQ